MPDKSTLKRARRDARAGKSASTQAGEFVREQIHHIRQGKHGARSTKQAIAIGLSEARRSGVKVPPSRGASKPVRERATRELRNGRAGGKPSATRSRATLRALRREGKSAASPGALSRQSRAAASRRSASDRSAAARRAARTRRRRA